MPKHQFTNFCFSVNMQLDYKSDPPLDDAKSLEKELTLNVAISQLASDFDRESNLCLERFSRTRHASVISIGSLRLDLALGIGGSPKGRMVEIFRKDASGKTALALHIVKEAQKKGAEAILLGFQHYLVILGTTIIYRLHSFHRWEETMTRQWLSKHCCLWQESTPSCRVSLIPDSLQ